MCNGVGEEERQRAHEALEKQEAELARYAEQVAAEQQQAAALEAKIKAMEEKARTSGILYLPSVQSPHAIW